MREEGGAILDDVEEVAEEDEDELDELQLGQVLSPPDLDLQGRAEVVGVHQDVDEAVEDHSDGVITSRVVEVDQQGGDGDGAVVVATE